MITGDRCAAQGIDPQSSKGCHSRESGNPCGASLRGELASLEAGCPAYAQWIPVPQWHAEKTGWPTGWPRARATSGTDWLVRSADVPVEALSMRFWLAASG